jgi:signal transduction histidine kinase
MIIPMSNLYGIVRSYRPDSRKTTGFLHRWTLGLTTRICHWGISPAMPETDRKKLIIFNRLNLFQLAGGILLLIALVSSTTFSLATYISLCIPIVISVLVLVLNKTQRYESALFSYFLLYPIATSNIYLRSIDFGCELYFILFGILSIFFIQETAKMIFSIALSMTSYFVLSVLWKDYAIQVESVHPLIYLAVQLSAILMIFYALYLLKNEQTRYQFKILAKNHVLQAKNEQIQQQNMEIETKAAELEEINTVKNKLFSVISHDLRAPIYALRNVFQHVKDYDMPAEDIKGLMPDVLNDLNYVTELMENLLQWAKSQMGGHKACPTVMELADISQKITGQLRNQAQAKQIILDDQVPEGLSAMGDKEMMSIVLRNLTSNAIKYTPLNGRITIGVRETRTHMEVFVKDNGVGISKDALRKIKSCTFYTSKGTASEGGTGLGLMLSREFIMKNGGQLQIKSSLGKGSEFSFTLPKVKEVVKAV